MIELDKLMVGEMMSFFKKQALPVTLLVLVVIGSSITILVDARKSLDHVSSFAVYYGEDEANKLSRFDLVIVSPLIDNATLLKLKSKGVIVVGYVSLTTLGNWEPWASFASPSMSVGKLEYWNENVMNACDARWARVILDHAIPYVMNRGFDGVFLDNLDIVDLYPWMKDCVINLVKKIREENPSIVMIVNRGFSIAREIAPYIDAILFEDFGTYYDFEKNKYLKWSGGDYQWMISVAEMLSNLSRAYGVKILALGYADLHNTSMLREYCDYVYSLASKYNFTAYVASISLDEVNTACPFITQTTSTIEANTTITREPQIQAQSTAWQKPVATLAFIALTVLLLLLALSRKTKHTH